MWDKDGVKQISPTGRQSPHTHNDSLNHPSHFPERVYGLSATQVHIHLSPAWLGAKWLLHRFMEYFGLEKMLEVIWATPVCSPKRAFPGLTAEDHKFFWSKADCQPHWRSSWPWKQVALLTLKKHKDNTKENTSRKNDNRKANCCILIKVVIWVPSRNTDFFLWPLKLINMLFMQLKLKCNKPMILWATPPPGLSAAKCITNIIITVWHCHLLLPSQGLLHKKNSA